MTKPAQRKSEDPSELLRLVSSIYVMCGVAWLSSSFHNIVKNGSRRKDKGSALFMPARLRTDLKRMRSIAQEKSTTDEASTSKRRNDTPASNRTENRPSSVITKTQKDEATDSTSDQSTKKPQSNDATPPQQKSSKPRVSGHSVSARSDGLREPACPARQKAISDITAGPAPSSQKRTIGIALTSKTLQAARETSPSKAVPVSSPSSRVAQPQERSVGPARTARVSRHGSAKPYTWTDKNDKTRTVKTKTKTKSSTPTALKEVSDRRQTGSS